MDGFEKIRAKLADLGISIVAGTVDNEADTKEVAASLNFPVAFGMERSDAEAIGAWWDHRRDHIQPSEFILDSEGKVMASTYSNSPLGRMDPAETLVLMKAILT